MRRVLVLSGLEQVLGQAARLGNPSAEVDMCLHWNAHGPHRYCVSISVAAR